MSLEFRNSSAIGSSAHLSIEIHEGKRYQGLESQPSHKTRFHGSNYQGSGKSPLNGLGYFQLRADEEIIMIPER